MAMTETRLPIEPDWAVGWEGHRRLQIRMWAALTPEQRLDALEQLIRFAHEVGSLRPRGFGPPPAHAPGTPAGR